MIKFKLRYLAFVVLAIFLVGCFGHSIYSFKTKLPSNKWAYKPGKVDRHKSEQMIVKGSNGAISINIIRVNQTVARKNLDEAVKAFKKDLKEMKYKDVGEKVYKNAKWKLLSTEHKAYNIIIKELVAFTNKGKSEIGVFFTGTPKSLEKYKADFYKVVESLEIIPDKKK